jgi:integrase
MRRLGEHVWLCAIALVSVCFGLHISECMVLKWSDVAWLNSRLSIQRSIVRQRIGETNTENSERRFAVSAKMLAVLRQWTQRTQFVADTDWVFASPAHIGRWQWSAHSFNDACKEVAKGTGIGHVSTHVTWHT